MMPNRPLARALIAGAILWMASIGMAADLDSGLAVDSMPIADLLAKVRADEAWIWNEPAFYVRMENLWRNPAETLEARIADLKKKWPDQDFSDPTTRIQFRLLPEIHERFELGWDAKRFAYRMETEESDVDHRVYDGTRTWIHEFGPSHGEEHYALGMDLTPNLSDAIFQIAIGRVAFPRVWWLQPVGEAQVDEPAESFEDRGAQTRDGRRFRVFGCEVPSSKELWVDCETGRLAHIKSFFHPTPTREAMKRSEEAGPAFVRINLSTMVSMLCEENPEAFRALDGLDKALDTRSDWPTTKSLELYTAAIMKIAGQPLPKDPEGKKAARREFAKAYCLEGLRLLAREGLLDLDPATLEPAIDATLREHPDFVDRVGKRGMQKAVAEGLVDRLLGEPQPFYEFQFSDWRPVAKDKWFPFEQGQTNYCMEWDRAGQLDSERAFHIRDVQLNAPPESLFDTTMKEGIQVNDFSYNPCLTYTYQKEFRPEQWQAILDQWQARADESQARHDAEQSLVGQPAPPFRVKEWIQGGPLSLSQLKGKYVVLHFAADFCGPCKNDYPNLERWDAAKDESVLAIVEIMQAVSDEAKVREIIEQFGLHYPVAIDRASEKKGALGAMFDDFKVREMPHAALIDRQGRIAAQGSLGEVSTEARRRMAEEAK